MKISKYWFRTRKDKGFERSLISLDIKPRWSTHCQCNECGKKFNRNANAQKLDFDLCDSCKTSKESATRFTAEVRKKISIGVSKAYSDPKVRENKSRVTKQVYKDLKNKEKQKVGCQKRSADPLYRQKLIHAVDPIKISCGLQGIEVKDFKNFLTSINTRDREHFKQTVGKQCLQNANFQCDVCSKGGKLNAHHKNGWHWAVNERFDLNNLVCLCKKCHISFHMRYGNRDNTKEQYEEFKLKRQLELV